MKKILNPTTLWHRQLEEICLDITQVLKTVNTANKKLSCNFVETDGHYWITVATLNKTRTDFYKRVIINLPCWKEYKSDKPEILIWFEFFDSKDGKYFEDISKKEYAIESILDPMILKEIYKFISFNRDISLKIFKKYEVS